MDFIDEKYKLSDKDKRKGFYIFNIPKNLAILPLKNITIQNFGTSMKNSATNAIVK